VGVHTNMAPMKGARIAVGQRGLALGGLFGFASANHLPNSPECHRDHPDDRRENTDAFDHLKAPSPLSAAFDYSKGQRRFDLAYPAKRDDAIRSRAAGSDGLGAPSALALDHAHGPQSGHIAGDSRAMGDRGHIGHILVGVGGFFAEQAGVARANAHAHGAQALDHVHPP